MLRRERKEQKRQRVAMKRYVALRMEEDIEASVAAVTRKAKRMRKAAEINRVNGKNAPPSGT
jgi:hypothetical protein